MLGLVVTLLNAMGLGVSIDDEVLGIIADNATERLLNKLNRDDVPDGLILAWSYMVVGEYLKYAKNAGKLKDAEGNDIVDLDAAVSSISEGDTSVSYAVGASSGSSTPEQRLDALIDWLTGYIDSDRGYLRYRRLTW